MTTTDANSARRAWQARTLQPAIRDQALAEGFTDLQARLLAGRLQEIPGTTLRALVRPSVNELPRASSLPDIDKAVDAIVAAIEGDLVIAVLADSDADGVNSGAIAWRALVEVCGVAPERVHVVTAHRRKDGYGVSAGLAERVAALVPRPNVAITVDQGSADQQRLADLRDLSIPVVVTDHHELPPEGPPTAALACVNPVRSDSEFGDPCVAGCGVIWYVFAAVHQELSARRYPRLAPAKDLLNLLSLAAIGTTADCVDLGTSYANRWIVQQGLARASSLNEPIWRAFNPFVRGQWNAVNVAFNLIPKVGAAGRMGDAMRGVEALCSKDDKIAMQWVAVLDQANTTRKEIQKRMVAAASEVAAGQVAEGAMGLCIPFFQDGHSGIQGIVAARIVEETGRPTVCICPIEGAPDMLTGSIRSVAGAHVKNILDAIAEAHPLMGLKGGGHAGAGGLRIPRAALQGFALAWDAAVREALDGQEPEPRWHDGDLGRAPSVDVLDEIDCLEPFGRGFPDPIFEATVQVQRIATLGRDGKHAQLTVTFPDGSQQRAAWFNCCDDTGRLPAVRGRVRLVYQLRRSTFERGPGYDVLVQEIVDVH